MPVRTARTLLLPPLILFLYTLYRDTSTRPSTALQNGDCPALLQSRRPTWARRERHREGFREFRSVYATRPVRDNVGGMQLDHAYGLWSMLRDLNPTVVIESGAHNGQSTWLIRQALPTARVISLDPREAVRMLKGVEYLTGSKFRDFGKLDWKGMGVDVEGSVVFLDDHQSGRRRVFEEGASMGFRRFIMDDNYEYLKGDNLSLRWLCEMDGKERWPGWVADNFGRNRTRQNWEEHLMDAEMLRKRVKYYYEFPPVVSSELSAQTRFDERVTNEALFTTKEEFDRELAGVTAKEMNMYTHMAYVEIVE